MSKLRRHALPCINEGAVLEWCNTCSGELKHVRECDINEKCTRGNVSHLVKACVDCENYVPDRLASFSTVKPESLPEGKSNTPKVARIPRNNRTDTTGKVKSVLPAHARRRLVLEMLKNKREEQMRNKQSGKVSSGPEPVAQTQKILGGIRETDRKPLTWAYGITCVPERFNNILKESIKSLANSGFDNPHLFMDKTTWGKLTPELDRSNITLHGENVRTFGNWMLSMLELYILNPKADRFVIFQDDIIACSGLKEYLEATEYPDKGYLNLITYPQNEAVKRAHFKGLPEDQMIGWYPSNQLGKGAQGLVFNKDALITLLTSDYMLERPQDERRGWRGVDGGIVNAMKKKGYTEYVHSPSLIRHTGKTSTMGNAIQPVDLSFKGENWNAMDLLSRKENANTLSEQPKSDSKTVSITDEKLG